MTRSTGVEVTGGAGTVWDYVLLLPPGWVGLPTGAAEARRAVAALLDRRLRKLPRDEVATGRRIMERQLRAQLGEARVAGASEVYAQVDLIRGMPVSAGLTVSRQQVRAQDKALLSGLGAVLGTAEGVVESGPVALDIGLVALRRVRRFQHVAAEGTPPQEQTTVEWVVPLPDCDDLLVLAFATSTPQVAEALVMLFDAVAQSLEIAPRPLDA